VNSTPHTPGIAERPSHAVHRGAEGGCPPSESTAPASPEAFRAQVRSWLEEHLYGEAGLSGGFAELIGRGGPGREHELIEERLAWERELGEGGWIGLGWPEADGGRGLSWERQVIFHEEYVRAGGPGRVGHIGEQLVGPTLLQFGTPEQKATFLPGILDGTQMWCQGYSEPDAGSDLANVKTRATLTGGEWHIGGQKVWTSLAQHADWCFVIARTDPESKRHKGLSYLLVPMRQKGVEVRPIVQLTGTHEFNEVFFDDAVTGQENVVGRPGDGWKVAMGTLAVERGVSTFGQQMGFQREFEQVLTSARDSGAIGDPDIAGRLTDAWIGLRVLRYTAQGTLGAQAEEGERTLPVGSDNIAKLLWANWHRDLGELAVDVTGPDATVTEPGYDLSDAQRLFLFTRADTIYGGSNEIQRNVIAERMLGLPRGK
jgi:alkylation response protein AidB-like acyl-CoA dehydrogenase